VDATKGFGQSCCFAQLCLGRNAGPRLEVGADQPLALALACRGVEEDRREIEKRMSE
jgi:hypothetical protein